MAGLGWSGFPAWAARVGDWAARYHGTLRDRPVRSQVAPGDVARGLGTAAPEAGEPLDDIFADFERVVMPGLTHWQHPRFFAYFPNNATPASVVAEYLGAALNVQGMLWQTSPAATEMETRVLDWLRQAMGLPDAYHGVIQDSASSATLAAVLTMRERALDWRGNADGLSAQPRLRIYASAEVHTSIDRAIWVAGIGGDNLVRVPTTGPRRAMDSAALRRLIAADRAAGCLPVGIIACTGGTSVGACDDIAGVADVAEAEGLFLHLDAAWAGNAMICPEYRDLWTGAERADSIVFNPYKWIGGQFDGSVHFLRSPEDLTRTLAIRPSFLRTDGLDGIVDYSEWSIPLGRRFRALKLWFLLRHYGLEELRSRIRNHVAWSGDLAERLRTAEGLEIVTDPVLSLFTFRLTGGDARTAALVQAINDDGRIYVTPTTVDGRAAIRFQVGQWDCSEDDVRLAGDVILALASDI